MEDFVSKQLNKIDSEESTQRLAVLIDADNAQAVVMEGLFAEIARYGEATVKRIYGDFTSKHSAQWKKVLNKFAIKPVQQFAYTTGKNATDSTMIIDAMDLLYTQRFDGFCIVSSDSDFTGLAGRIREEGLTVYGFGENKTPEAFRNACHKFIRTEYLRPDSSADDTVLVAASNIVKDKSARNQAIKKTNLKQNKVNNAVVDASIANIENEVAPNLSNSDQVMVTTEDPVNTVQEFPLMLFRKAIKANSKDDGWANLSGVGSYILRVQPDFDQRDYGYDKLGDLVKAKPNLFDIEDREVPNSFSKQVWIRMHKKTRSAPAA